MTNQLMKIKKLSDIKVGDIFYDDEYEAEILAITKDKSSFHDDDFMIKYKNLTENIVNWRRFWSLFNIKYTRKNCDWDL